jgi:hypothetical protein
MLVWLSGAAWKPLSNGLHEELEGVGSRGFFDSSTPTGSVSKHQATCGARIVLIVQVEVAYSAPCCSTLISSPPVGCTFFASLAGLPVGFR